MAGDGYEIKGQTPPPPDSGSLLRLALTGLLCNKDHPQNDTIWQMSEERGQEEQLLLSASDASDLKMNGQGGSVLPTERICCYFPAPSFFRFFYNDSHSFKHSWHPQAYFSVQMLHTVFPWK